MRDVNTVIYGILKITKSEGLKRHLKDIAKKSVYLAPEQQAWVWDSVAAAIGIFVPDPFADEESLQVISLYLNVTPDELREQKALMEGDEEVDTFERFDMRTLKNPMVTVYYNTLDFPDTYVARLFNMGAPTKFHIVRDSLDEIRKALPKGLTFLGKSPSDDPVIVEVWL